MTSAEQTAYDELRAVLTTTAQRFSKRPLGRMLDATAFELDRARELGWLSDDPISEREALSVR